MPANLSIVFTWNASLALLAPGMLVVIVSGGIDLSLGSVMAIAIASRAGAPWVLGPLIGLACLKLPHPLIMRLGPLDAARGLT